MASAIQPQAPFLTGHHRADPPHKAGCQHYKDCPSTRRLTKNSTSGSHLTPSLPTTTTKSYSLKMTESSTAQEEVSRNPAHPQKELPKLRGGGPRSLRCFIKAQTDTLANWIVTHQWARKSILWVITSILKKEKLSKCATQMERRFCRLKCVYWFCICLLYTES